MTIIAQNIDAAGVAYHTTDDYQNVTVIQNVVVSGEDGLDVYYNAGDPFTNDNFFNYGTIDASSSGIGLDSDDNSVYNGATGYINGADGINILDIGVSHNDNSIVNDGHIHGNQAGIYVDGELDTIDSTGVISSGKYGIDCRKAAFLTIHNSGLISGETEAIDGSGSSLVTLNNSGTIDGDMTFGVAAGIRNTGSIIGDIRFGSSADTFDGRGGTVNGEIYGGSNADTIHLGNDGETVRGGDGADVIYAGAGADTFVFSHLSQYDVDRVHGFNVAQDTIQLEQRSFIQLTVDAPVVFATSTKATSATDLLFYNPTSGALYYDADGSGTKATAHVIAHLDTGLHLTSANFQVVPGPPS